MLTREHAIVDYRGVRAFPDRLTTGAHGHYRGFAARMLELYDQGIGETRKALHARVSDIFACEPDCDPRRIRAFCKLLDEKGQYDQDSRGKASALRLKVFSLAARYHPLVAVRSGLFENQEQEVKARIAEEMGMAWEEIDNQLYRDVIHYNRLSSFTGYSCPEELLARYNVAQVQAALYSATVMTVEASEDFKLILRYAKLARLLHTIKRLDKSRYRIDFTGPASMLRKTTMYGVAFAKFLPSLLTCRDWKMSAKLQTRWGRSALLELASTEGLGGRFNSLPEFDSSVEEKFAKKFGEERDGWTLVREGAILHKRQKTFVPDFVFRHQDGTEVLFEIVGFWTPEYLEAKQETLQVFSDKRILLGVCEKLAEKAWLKGLPQPVFTYKTVLKINQIMEMLEKERTRA